MNTELLGALVAMLPIGALLIGSAVAFRKQRELSTWLQMIGSMCLLLVVGMHFAEALNVFPGMQWGQEHSVGHYLDFASATLGITLFAAGYLIRVLRE